VGFAAAQDSSIEAVRVAATGAYAGFHGIPGRDMGAANIEVVGGRYGLVTRAAAGNVIVGARFLNQTHSAIVHTDFVPLAMVGFHIVKAKGPVITTQSKPGTTAGTMSLLDGVIVVNGAGPAIDNASGKSLYLRNVYVKGTASLVKSGAQPAVTGAGTWARIAEYAYTDQRPADGDYQVNDTTLRAVNLIDGKTSQAPEPSTHVENGAVAPPNLVARHLWTALPSFEGQKDGTAVVTAAKYGAKPDDAADDRAAIQAAIDDASAAGHGRVFIPRGLFRIGGTGRLHANTRLFGVSRILTEIGVHDSWRPTTGEATMLLTDDDAEATTTLAFLRITARTKGGPTLPSGAAAYDRFNQLHWRAGRRSTVAGIQFSTEYVASNTPTNAKSIMKITGSGGGRHYFLSAGKGGYQVPATHPDMRGPLISGTQEPLWVYGLNMEMSKGADDVIIDANCEIENAANVRILSMKREGRSPSVVIRNSTNIGLFSGEDNTLLLSLALAVRRRSVRSTFSSP
jgi:hypothetical protein